jgi:hypothetical protein
MKVVDLAGFSVAEVLSLLDLDYDSIELVDEPPGRLRVIEIPPKGPDAETIVLELAGDPLPFSEEREWEKDDVLALTVARVRPPAGGAGS